MRKGDIGSLPIGNDFEGGVFQGFRKVKKYVKDHGCFLLNGIYYPHKKLLPFIGKEVLVCAPGKKGDKGYFLLTSEDPFIILKAGGSCARFRNVEDKTEKIYFDYHGRWPWHFA